MPKSQQPDEGVQVILERLAGRKVNVVDCGTGEGKWGTLIAPIIRGQIDGIEAWPSNVQKARDTGAYRKVYQGDIRAFGEFTAATYDVAILGDVLEHLTKTDAMEFISRLQKSVSEIYLVIPVCICIQSGEAWGNPFETHLYHWSDRELRDELGFTLLRFDTNENHLVVIGAYQWKRGQ